MQFMNHDTHTPQIKSYIKDIQVWVQYMKRWCMQVSSLDNTPFIMWENLLQARSRSMYNVDKLKHVDYF